MNHPLNIRWSCNRRKSGKQQHFIISLPEQNEKLDNCFVGFALHSQKQLTLRSLMLTFALCTCVFPLVISQPNPPSNGTSLMIYPDWTSFIFFFASKGCFQTERRHSTFTLQLKDLAFSFFQRSIISKRSTSSLGRKQLKPSASERIYEVRSQQLKFNVYNISFFPVI